MRTMRQARDNQLSYPACARPARKRDGTPRHIGDAFATISDVTSAWAVVSVMGKLAHALLAKVSPDDIANFAPGEMREIDLGLARVRAARMSYVGGPGIQLYIPSQCASHVYDALPQTRPQLRAPESGHFP